MKYYFYPQSIHTSVLAFSDYFNNMSVRVYDTKGEIVGIKPVPCTLTPREKIVSIIKARNGSINDVDPQVDNYLPRLTINMTGLSLDMERMSGKYEKRLLNIEYDTGTKRKMQIDYQPVPYKLNFEVVIWAKYMVDGVQLIENISPWFAPEGYVSYKERSFGLERKAKVEIESITPNHVYEFGEADRRILQWTLNFSMEHWMYKPMQEIPEIKCAIISINDVPCKKSLMQGSEIVIYEPVSTEPKSLYDTTPSVNIYDLDPSEEYQKMIQYWRFANNNMTPPVYRECVTNNCNTTPISRPEWDPSTPGISACGGPVKRKPLLLISTNTANIYTYWQEIINQNGILSIISFLRGYDHQGNEIYEKTQIPNDLYPPDDAIEYVISAGVEMGKIEGPDPFFIVG